MTECDSYNIFPNLRANISNDQQFRLNKIIEIKDSFMVEIKERELISKILVSILLLLSVLTNH